jgi:hypothetical protein
MQVLTVRGAAEGSPSQLQLTAYLTTFSLHLATLPSFVVADNLALILPTSGTDSAECRERNPGAVE